MKFDDACKYKLIYIFSIPDSRKHRGLLKIGDTTITTDRRADSLPPNCNALNAAAHERIKQYTTTAGIEYKLEYTALAVADKQSFRDYHVHRVLKRYKAHIKGSTGREWFKLDLDTAVNAIENVKRKLAAIKDELPDKIDFRPEQEEAISRTVKHFNGGGKDFLWNAKPRFGKTLCALEVVKRMNFAKTIIITHRPVVNENWFKDFPKIFRDNPDFDFGSKSNGRTLKQLLARKKNFVYFASIQDLRGSETVGGKFDKNSEIFDADWHWDFVIVDEAHEGTTTDIGKNVIAQLVKPETKRLELSGTPFNILERYGDNVFTWDYVSEQQAKADWDKEHFGDSNPYADLPQMHIYTYDLANAFGNRAYVDTEDKFFNFREFFRVNGNERFVHERDVKKFLDMLGMESDNNYPFSRVEFRELFKHTLWIVPGVKEGKALSALIKDHPAFCIYEVVNVAGDGDDDNNYTNALTLVQDAIADNDYTITLSCGKLTTGVTVPEWTAVLYLAGGGSTSAANYLQTIFRVQNPGVIDGKAKQNCFVFDFAPDRTLRMITEAATISPKAGKTKDGDRVILDELLKFCPVIAVSGSEMRYRADNLLRELKSAWIERAARNGFDDNCLYNDKLLQLDDLDWKKFEDLKARIGSAAAKKQNDITVNAQGLDEGKTAKTTSSKTPRTPEQIELDRRRRKRRNAISILRQISIRMPLLIYGANVPLEKNISIDEFAGIVDDASWEEFMPKGVTKEFFAEFIEYYDRDIFIGTGNKVREHAKAADSLTPTERVKEIAALFATFKNPDKETVLTPWNVVKLHIDSVFDEKFFTPDKKILEINSKTGLYPLYVACKVYRTRLAAHGLDEDKTPLKELRRLWDLSVANNVFALCKTPMAVTITRRTLIGYRRAVAHARHFDKLIDTLKTKPQDFFKRVTNAQFWDKGVGTMFFDAAVGNPPYQSTGSGDNKTFAAPVYHEFLKAAYNEKLTKRASLIHPARILSGAGAIPGDFPEKFIADTHVRLVKHFLRSQDAFPTSDIKGGVAITEFDATKTFEPIGLYIPFDELIAIHEKVVVNNPNFKPLSEIVFGRTKYFLTEQFIKDHPAAPFLDRRNDFFKSNVFKYAAEYFFDKKPADGRQYIQVCGLDDNGKRITKFIRRNYIGISDNNLNFDKFKVFVPEANGSGALGEVVSTPLVGLPLVGCTQTFITVGAFDTRAEADACIAYIKTKFCRALLGILKVTQHNPPQTWSKVPLQDFTSASDIDWSLSIPEIDAQLYEKYGLTDAERDFIESHVKAMT